MSFLAGFTVTKQRSLSRANRTAVVKGEPVVRETTSRERGVGRTRAREREKQERKRERRRERTLEIVSLGPVLLSLLPLLVLNIYNIPRSLYVL